MTAVHAKDYLDETGETWSADKAKAYRDVFLTFLDHCVIPSKEKGMIRLGGQLYPAQERVLDGIFAGLQRGVHDFKMGKGRQQGISTICRPFSMMWIALHPGSRGAFVLDTAQHMAEARTEVEYIIANLPPKLKFPAFQTNRYGGKFANGSVVSFLAAGVKQTAAGGALGRGQGITMCHGSEIGTWNNPEGVSSFRKSLAVENPNRLFLWESTGRNVGSDWWKMWQKAVANDLEEATIFTGWYLVPTHRIREGTAQFEKYGSQPITRDEARRIAEVERRYDWQITREQLAWYRKESNPSGYGDGDSPEEDAISEDEYQSREHPWVEEEMFTTEGSNFFSSDRLTYINKEMASDSFKPYKFFTGSEFIHMSIEPARNRRETQLRVWEEPKPDGVYVISADPAFGANEHNDRSAAQVMRCYADKLEQVAEFASATVQPHQFAWVIASLMGWYRNTRLILEINGPGAAVWQEFTSLKRVVANGYLKQEADDLGLKNYFQNCKNYLYSRPDAVVPGQGSLHWKTSSANKVMLLERTRDFLTNGGLILRSKECVEEMRSITRDGDQIRAEGDDHDDRVIALAIAIICWEQNERRGLIASGRTREKEIARTRLSVQDQFALLSSHHIDRFFKGKANVRRQMLADAARSSWRSGS